METRSNNYEFLKPHEDDFYDIEVQNGNWDKVDEALKEIDNKKVNTSGGDISETVIKTLEEQEDFPEIPASGPVKTIFGKIRKNLEDWKAFKDGIVTIGRLSNIDANDSDKIPTSAFVHTLYKRIGMETELAAGDNLTVAVNRLDSDLNGVITDKSYNNDTIIDMVKAHWEDLPTGISTKQFNSGGNLWYLICNKANAAAGAYFLYTHNPAFKSPIYGQCQNGIWYDQGGIALSNHTHDDRYYTETEIKKMMSSQYENNTGKLATSALVYGLKQYVDSKLSTINSVRITGSYVDIVFNKSQSLVNIIIMAHPKQTLPARQEKLNCAIPAGYIPRVNVNNSDVWADGGILYTALRDGDVYITSSYDVTCNLWYSANFSYFAK